MNTHRLPKPQSWRCPRLSWPRKAKAFWFFAAVVLGIWTLLWLVQALFGGRDMDTLALPTLQQRTFGSVWFKYQNQLELRYYAWTPSTPPSPVLSRSAANGPGTLLLARDLRLKEIPPLLRLLEADAWGDEHPKYATSYLLSRMALAGETVLSRSCSEGSAWMRPWKRRRLRAFHDWRSFAFPLSEREDIPAPDQPWPELKNRWKAEVECEEARQLLGGFMDDLLSAPQKTETRMAIALKEGFLLGCLQTGAHRLARNLMGMTPADLEAYQADSRAGEGNYHYLGPEASALPEHPQSVWAALEIPKRRQALDLLRSRGSRQALVEYETRTLRDVLIAVQAFPYVDDDPKVGLTFTPASILERKAAQCVGKSVLIHAYLQALGIDHEAFFFPNHVAICARTSDGQQWYLEGTSRRPLSNLKGVLVQNRLHWLPPLGMELPPSDVRLFPFLVASVERSLAVGILKNLKIPMDFEAGPGNLLTAPGEMVMDLAESAKYADKDRELPALLSKLHQALPGDPAVVLDRAGVVQGRK